jgi:GT2 family glycosyltransferase
MLDRLRQRPDAGLCGSTVLFYDQPGRVQAFGGARYFPRLGLAMHVGRIFGRRRHVPAADIERQLDYVSGASMLVTREFVKAVGLMSEDYFLYYEELDWAMRGRPDFGLAYAPDSIVYHRSGAAIGSNRHASKRSRLSEFYLQRNRLRFTRKFFPRCLPTVRSIQLFELAARLVRLDWDRAQVLLDAIRAADSGDSRAAGHGD